MKPLETIWAVFENNPWEFIFVALAIIAGMTAGQLYKGFVIQIFVALTNSNKLTIRCASLHNAMSSVICVGISYWFVLMTLPEWLIKKEIIALCLALCSPMLYDGLKVALKFWKPELAARLEISKEKKNEMVD